MKFIEVTCDNNVQTKISINVDKIITIWDKKYQDGHVSGSISFSDSEFEGLACCELRSEIISKINQ